MSDKSAIEWTEATWNPTTGCTKVSPGCAHCYAEALSLRHGWSKKPWLPANEAENVILHPDRLEQPFSWRAPRRVFVDSMSDLFHEQIPFGFIDGVFRVMEIAERHTFQILTKRPNRMRDYIESRSMNAVPNRRSKPVLPNVWLGVTVENQHWADERIPTLLSTPAAVRFVSAEPLLGALDLRRYLKPFVGCPWDSDDDCSDCRHYWGPREKCGATYKAGGLDWLIIGGESGSHHRLFDLDWARQLLNQCKGTGCRPFVKQLGGFRPGNKLEDLPPDLRVREYPALGVAE